MDKIDLDELERLAKAATPGPWATEDLYNITHYDEAHEWHGIVIQADICGKVIPSEANAAYIVADCNSLPDLIAENRALQERVRELEELSDRAIDEAGYLLGCMPTLDCRVCDYHDYCPEPMPGFEPDIETCRATMRNFCDPNGEPINKEAGDATSNR